MGGERIDMETLGLYEVRDKKFARAQMFYFDTAALLRFLRRAEWALGPRPDGSRPMDKPPDPSLGLQRRYRGDEPAG